MKCSILNKEEIDVNLSNNDYVGSVPLHVACHNGNLDIIKLLINRNDCNLLKTDKNNCSWFIYATKNKQITVLRYVYQYILDNIDSNANNRLGKYQYNEKSMKIMERTIGRDTAYNAYMIAYENKYNEIVDAI